MRLRYLYQSYSIGNTGRIPVFCDAREAWLGRGFYFWDSSQNDAHWWGRTHYDGLYSICRTQYDYDSPDYFDLVGNTEHIACFERYAELLLRKCHGKRTIRVCDVLGFMGRINKSFVFKAYRAWPIPRRTLSRKFFYDRQQDFFYAKQDKIQMCVTELDFLTEDCKIVFTSIDPNSVV